MGAKWLPLDDTTGLEPVVHKQQLLLSNCFACLQLIMTLCFRFISPGKLVCGHLELDHQVERRAVLSSVSTRSAQLGRVSILCYICKPVNMTQNHITPPLST